MSASKEISCRTGDLVDLYDEGGLVCAVVLGSEKGRLKIMTETGKEMRVTASRVAHRAGSVSAIPSQAAAAARRHGEAAASRAEQIDLPSLWDVLVDAPQRETLGSLAALALGSDDPLSRSALLRRLHEDRIYFARKGDDFEPRSRDHIEEVMKREAAERARAERRAAFLDLARAALAGGLPAQACALPGPEHRETIADLVELALVGDEAGSRKEAVPLLDDAGVSDGPSAERAFRLLRALGIFHEDENLFVHRFRLRNAFPPEIEERAARDVEAAAVAMEGRRDLRHLSAFTIDDEQTTEMDDALTVETTGPAVRLGVHIADPASFVTIGGPVDDEAISRAATYYFPEVKLPMLPSVVAERAASLVAGEDRLALSFLVTLSPMGEVIDSEILSSVIRSRARLTYEQADALLEDAAAGDEIARALKSLVPVCDALEAGRISAGAVVIRAAEVDIRVRPDGEIVIRRIDERGPARRMVAETMILANRLAAQFCVKRGIPAIYRRQAPPQEEAAKAAATPGPALEAIEAGGYDPVAVRALRRRMRRGEVSLAPAPHSGLGLPAYTQATSPIRRYQDLVVHRQIKAALLGRPLPYDAESLARIAASTDEAERAAREAERGTDEYWILKYYERRIGREVEGVVVAADARRVEVEMTDTLYNMQMPARPDWTPGRRVRFAIEASRPRAGKLTLRALDGSLSPLS